MPTILALSFAIVASVAGVAEPAPSTETLVERAVIAGDVQQLKNLREQLQSGGDSPYTLAYVDWRLWENLSKREQKACASEVELLLGKLIEDDPGNAEAYALLGSMYGKRITGAWSGIRLGPKASRAHDRASELDPNNPRIALQRGISAFFTPKRFGGGLDNAEREMRRAVVLFDRESLDKPWPNWGRAEVHAWLGQVYAKRDNVAGARSEYEYALELEPSYRWVRDVLLPALD
jgi:Flp pilus assembly protein TadD